MSMLSVIAFSYSAKAQTECVLTSGAGNATASASFACGDLASATGANSSAVGNQSSATGANSTAVGTQSSATGTNSIAVGFQANASGAFGNFDTLAIGSQAQAGTVAAGQNDGTAVGWTG